MNECQCRGINKKRKCNQRYLNTLNHNFRGSSIYEIVYLLREQINNHLNYKVKMIPCIVGIIGIGGIGGIGDFCRIKNRAYGQ